MCDRKWGVGIICQDKLFPTFFPYFLCFKGLEIISFDNENNIFGKI